jgi:biopolymer transport protein ExbD
MTGTNMEQKDPSKKAFPVLKRARKSAGGAEVESIDLDLTPFMNVCMIIIPFLVTMAVFTQISVIDFSLPPASQSGVSVAPVESKELDVSIVITNEGFRIVGTGKMLDLVPRIRGEFQFTILRGLLQAVKFQYPSQKSVVLVIDSDILYDDIVKFMDVCRESQFPDIGLSGEIR